MTKESAALLVAQQKPQMDGEMRSSHPSTIVPGLPADVKLLRDFVKRRHIPMDDLLEVVRTIYPRCDKSLLSKCAHGEETGAKLRTDALQALAAHFRESGKPPYTERNRKRPNRLVVRVTDSVFEVLQRRLRRTGQSVQDYMEALILEDLKEDIHNGAEQPG